MVRKFVRAILRRFAVRENVVVGQRFQVGMGSILWAPRSLSVGDDVYVGKNVTIQADGVIGDGVLFANLSGVVGRTDHRIDQIGTVVREGEWVGNSAALLSRRTIIGTDVWIGYGAIVLSGIVVGDSSIIGAGSVVTRDVPPNSIVVGNPAKVVASRFAQDALDAHWASLKASGRRLQPFAESLDS